MLSVVRHINTSPLPCTCGQEVGLLVVEVCDGDVAGALEHRLGGGGVVEVAQVGLPSQLAVTTQELWQSFEY